MLSIWVFFSGSHYGALDGAAESATRLLGGLMRYLSGSAKRGRKYDRKPKRRRSKRTQNRKL